MSIPNFKKHFFKDHQQKQTFMTTIHTHVNRLIPNELKLTTACLEPQCYRKGL